MWTTRIFYYSLKVRGEAKSIVIKKKAVEYIGNHARGSS